MKLVKINGVIGVGVASVDRIRKRAFVGWYTGLVRGASVCREALLARAHQHFYMMSLGGELTIDATKFGNLTRFINHSCDPNCMAVLDYAGDEKRVAIVALRDIEAGTELTIDYRFELVGNVVVPCLCGAANCTGHLARNVDKHGNKLM